MVKGPLVELYPFIAHNLTYTHMASFKLYLKNSLESDAFKANLVSQILLTNSSVKSFKAVF